jgi:hypothetical protein
VKSWASWKSLCTIAAAVFGSAVSQACNPPSPPVPDVSTQVYLDTTGTVVNLDSIRNQLTQFKGPTVSFERRATCAGCVVKVELTRLGKTRDIKPDDGPDPARQIAYLKNTDTTDSTEMYKMAPGQTYALQIGRSKSGAADWSVVEIPPGHTGVLRVTAHGPITSCTPHHTPGLSKVTFANCDDHAGDVFFPGSAMIDFKALKAMLTGMAKSFAHPFRGEMLERRAWFSCDYGCCTA